MNSYFGYHKWHLPQREMHTSGLYSLIMQLKSSSCEHLFNCPALGFQQPPLCPGVPLQSACSERGESAQSAAVLNSGRVWELCAMPGTSPGEPGAFLLNSGTGWRIKWPLRSFHPKTEELSERFSSPLLGHMSLFCDHFSKFSQPESEF